MNSENIKEKTGIVRIACYALAFILLTCGIICGASGLLRRKESERKYSDFIENADKVDVLFFGSSHMLNAMSPAQLYKERGITSYNMAKPGGVLPEAYWTYELARQYVKPKCVVVDLWSLDRDYHYIDVMNGEEDEEQAVNSVSLLHTNMDVWPLNKTKIRAVNDLISTPAGRMEFLFDFSLYHGRWSNLLEDDFGQAGQFEDTQYLLGAEANRYMITNYNIFEPDDKSQTLEEETESVRYLKMLIEECRSEGTEVVLTFMPMGGSYYQDYQAVNYGKELAEEYGIEFVDMLDPEEDIVDLEYDMSDDSHLNEFGMSKVTRYLGKKLAQIDSLTDHRGQEGYELFDRAAKYLDKTRLSSLKDETDLHMTMGYLNMIGCDFALLLRHDSAALKDKITTKQVAEITGTNTINDARNIDGPYFLMKQHLPENGVTLFERAGASEDSDIETNRGKAEYIGMNEFNALYFDGNYEENLFDMEDMYFCTAQVFVFDKDGEVICKKYIDSHFTAVQE